VRPHKRNALLDRVAAALRTITLSPPAVYDAVLVFVAFCLTFAAVEYYQLPHRIFAFTIQHEDLELDDILIASFIAALGLLFYSARRLIELRREIKARRTAEKTVLQLARHDPLTGLPNRRYFNERLDEAIHNTLVEGHRVAVMILDLDGFKPLNDMYGHLIGDKALVEFAARISRTARGVLVTRVGDDEFAIILPAIASLDEPASLARRIASAVSEPFEIAGIETELAVSIGIAVAPDDGNAADELVRRAVLALNRARADDRASTRFFEPLMDAHVERRAAIERELRAAITNDQIEMWYQPLVNLDSGRIIGFEALARWNNPVLGTVFPSVFIAIAEESGLIHRLGDQLLRTACRDAKSWPGQYTLAFNLSPVQLRDPTLGLRVLGILGETGLAPSRLELEITESAIVSDGEMTEHLIDEFRKSGIRVALDDFGTGYATMSQLLSFRFDKIKIDRSFVSKLGSDSDSQVIVRAIVGLAHGLGLTTTAEGIETAEQLAELKADGCHEGQGYLFGKAMPAAAIPNLLRNPSIAAA
jgi:diguanylate cyclase (GGDEF)-like protein